MKTIFSLCIGIFLSLSLSAQINPPDLLCVTTLFNGDVELTWDLPTNTCGSTFNGYRVYISNDPTQPFNLLTIVTNPTQTTYTHTNANGTNITWYYYLTTDLVCPNEIPVQSVTLDNRQPDVTEIDYVTVNDAGNIELHWLQNASPETFGYIILWETTSGFVAIDRIHQEKSRWPLYPGIILLAIGTVITIQTLFNNMLFAIMLIVVGAFLLLRNRQVLDSMVDIKANVDIVKMDVYSIEGRLLYQFNTLPTTNPTLDLSNLLPGTYLLKLHSAEAEAIKILVKE